MNAERRLSQRQQDAMRHRTEMEIAGDKDFLAGCSDATAGLDPGRSGGYGGQSEHRRERYRAGYQNGRAIRGH